MLELPPPLPEDVLALRAALPLKPAPVILDGSRVRLRPVDPARDAEPLYAASHGEDSERMIWRFMSQGPFDSLADFRAYLERLAAAPNQLAFCVEDRTGARIGITTYMNNVPADLKIELGNIWYVVPAQKTGANTEATYLMLRHAFALGYRRVEWKCNVLNERSRQAALRMGFQFEGIQQAHMIIKGRSRDTAWYRILRQEWPDVEKLLFRLLASRHRGT